MTANLLLAGSVGDQLNSVFYNMDMSIFRFFGSIQSGFLTAIAKIFTAMGAAEYIALIAVLGLILCFFKRTRKAGLAVVFAVIIGTLITNVIVKPLVMRIRPYNTLQHDAQYWAWYLGAGRLSESDYSFTSGHTTGAFEVAISLMLYFISVGKKKIAWIFPVVAVLTAVSRIYLMVHYASDVFVAVIIGCFSGVMGYLISSAICKKLKGTKLDDRIDLARFSKKGISRRAGIAAIAVAWALIFGFSYLRSVNEGGDNIQRCAYNREYDCQNEAQIHSKKYPSINGEYYCKIHWKQLNEQFEETGGIDGYSADRLQTEPVVNTDVFTFYNDPQVSAFKDRFYDSPPLKMVMFKPGVEITVTDQNKIREVFEALKKVTVGEELGESDAPEPGGQVQYTFFTEEGTVTIGIEGPNVIGFNGKYYEIKDSGNAFNMIPDDYWEGMGDAA